MLNMQLNHGDVYMVNLGNVKAVNAEQNTSVEHGYRPCVIVSSSTRFFNSPVVMVAPMTTKVDAYPYHPITFLNSRNGEVMCDQITTIDVRSQLGDYVGTLSEGEIAVVDIEMKRALGLF